MTLSEQLSKLSTRTKVLEDRFAASKEEARAELEQDVKAAREASRAKAEELHKSIETSEAEVSAWWDDVANGWNKHMATVRQHIDDKVAAHDLKSAQRDAEEADEYASSRRYPEELPVLAALLPQIAVPVTVIAGAHDHVVPLANAEFLTERLPDARAVVLDAGHFLWEEEPEQYASAILSSIA